MTASNAKHAPASGFIEQSRRHKGNWILFAPYVPIHEHGDELPPTADQLRSWLAVVRELIDCACRV